jgi:hypothetical protein
MTLSQKGNIIFVDPEIAQLEGINIDRLIQHHAQRGTKIVTRKPEYIEGEDRWQCFGCMGAWERNHDTWRINTNPGQGEWQPLCRECEGTTLSDHPDAIRHRDTYRRLMEAKRAKQEGRTEPAVKSKHRTAGTGRPPRGRMR